MHTIIKIDYKLYQLELYQKFLEVSFMVKKNISEISKQIPGSLDFRIEVASACA